MCVQLHVLRMTLGKIPTALELGPHDFGGSLNTIFYLFCILWYFRAVGRGQAIQFLGWKILAAPSWHKPPPSGSQGEKGAYCPGSLLRGGERPPLCCPFIPGIATWFQGQAVVSTVGQ